MLVMCKCMPDSDICGEKNSEINIEKTLSESYLEKWKVSVSQVDIGKHNY